MGWSGGIETECDSKLAVSLGWLECVLYSVWVRVFKETFESDDCDGVRLRIWEPGKRSKTLNWLCLPCCTARLWHNPQPVTLAGTLGDLQTAVPMDL